MLQGNLRHLLKLGSAGFGSLPATAIAAAANPTPGCAQHGSTRASFSTRISTGEPDVVDCVVIGAGNTHVATAELQEQHITAADAQHPASMRSQSSHSRIHSRTTYI